MQSYHLVASILSLHLQAFEFGTQPSSLLVIIVTLRAAVALIRDILGKR
jgi:hypothetical protein